MDFLDFAAVPAIVVIVYLAATVYKCFWSNEQALRKIPAFCGVLGLALGVGCFYLTPELLGAGDVVTAAATGVVSGLAATGINQVWKQVNKGKEES